MNFKGAGACRDYRREQEDPSGTWRASFVSRTHIFEDKWGISRSLKCYGVGFSRLSWELGILPKHIGTFSMTKGRKRKVDTGSHVPIMYPSPTDPLPGAASPSRHSASSPAHSDHRRWTWLMPCATCPTTQTTAAEERRRNGPTQRLLSGLYTAPHWIHPTTLWSPSYCYTRFIDVASLRHREFKELAQEHTTRK